MWTNPTGATHGDQPGVRVTHTRLSYTVLADTGCNKTRGTPSSQNPQLPLNPIPKGLRHVRSPLFLTAARPPATAPRFFDARPPGLGQGATHGFTGPGPGCGVPFEVGRLGEGGGGVNGR